MFTCHFGYFFNAKLKNRTKLIVPSYKGEQMIFQSCFLA
ncbi:hypothetical protein IMCC3317_40650 [Kordia antarctica]|uniref:Uncharacterized protein n=1 Tax=Kordia antarctica TaxID=1218801 RepID=A0A7L4ZQ69_9FLAO|nr:hypothetical protein IMCC3317_40650 [Kordia antarctica]